LNLPQLLIDDSAPGKLDRTSGFVRVGQHPATALAWSLERITPYAWMWQLGSERIS